MSRSKSEHYKKNQLRACTTLKRREITKNYAFNFDIIMVSVYYNDQCFFLMQTIYRCCFLKQKRYLSIEMRKQKRNGF